MWDPASLELMAKMIKEKDYLVIYIYTSGSMNQQLLPNEVDTPVCPYLSSMSHDSYQTYME